MVGGGPLFGPLNLLRIILNIVQVQIYICAKGIFAKISIHIFLTFREVGGSPTSCAQKLLQKPIRSREQCAHKPIKPREQCAHKPIKPLRGPAPWAVLYFRLDFFDGLGKNNYLCLNSTVLAEKLELWWFHEMQKYKTAPRAGPLRGFIGL